MSLIHERHLKMIQQVAKSLGSLCDEVVFVGGITTTLLLTEEGAEALRSTNDVDVIASLNSYSEYYAFSEQLKSRGFYEETSGSVCRWRVKDIIVDVMPTSKEILGFTNRWYADAIKNAIFVDLGDELRVRVVSPVYFLATKLEAFYGRGNGDFNASHDIEDIISLIDGRVEIVGDVLSLPNDTHGVRAFLQTEFSKLLDNENFIASISGHLLPDHQSQSRVIVVYERLKGLVSRFTDGA